MGCSWAVDISVVPGAVEDAGVWRDGLRVSQDVFLSHLQVVSGLLELLLSLVKVNRWRLWLHVAEFYLDASGSYRQIWAVYIYFRNLRRRHRLYNLW